MAKFGKPQQPIQAKAPPPQPVSLVQTTLEVQSGPLPDPRVLAEYERVLPGAADRIFRMAETQQ